MSGSDPDVEVGFAHFDRQFAAVGSAIADLGSQFRLLIDSNDDLDVVASTRIEAFVRANDERRGDAPIDETCISEPLAEALRMLAESRAILDELISR